MDPDPPLTDLLPLLPAGDDRAARAVFDRYSNRLIRLAGKHLNQRLAGRVDPEDVVQSVFRTFFRRGLDGEFQLDGSAQPPAGRSVFTQFEPVYAGQTAPQQGTVERAVELRTEARLGAGVTWHRTRMRVQHAKQDLPDHLRRQCFDIGICRGTGLGE